MAETFTVTQTTTPNTDVRPGDTVTTTVEITNDSTTTSATGVDFTENLTGMTLVDQGNDANTHQRHQRLAARLRRQLQRRRQHPADGERAERRARRRRRQRARDARGGYRFPRPVGRHRHERHQGGGRHLRHQRGRLGHHRRRRQLHLHAGDRLHRHRRQCRHLHLYAAGRRPRRHLRQRRRPHRHRHGVDRCRPGGLVHRQRRRQHRSRHRHRPPIPSPRSPHSTTPTATPGGPQTGDVIRLREGTGTYNGGRRPQSPERPDRGRRRPGADDHSRPAAAIRSPSSRRALRRPSW